jgi:hypothetical protein
MACHSEKQQRRYLDFHIEYWGQANRLRLRILTHPRVLSHETYTEVYLLPPRISPLPTSSASLCSLAVSLRGCLSTVST